MAIVPMTDAVPGTVALAAEYNKLIDNIYDLDTRTTAVEAAVGGGTGEVPRKGGEFLLASQGSIGLGTLLTAWTPNGTPSGVSHSGGVFTLSEAGLYLMTLNVRFVNVGTADRYIWIAGAASNDTWAKAGTIGASFNLSTSVVRRVPAGQQVRCFAFYGTPSTTVSNENPGDELPGFAVYKIGN